MTNTTDYPDTYTGSSSYTYYRIADGELRNGSDKQGTKEVHKEIIGFFERVGEHSSEFGKETKEYIEVELKLKDGTKANVSVDKNNATGCLFLCNKLLNVDKGDYIAITVGKSKTANAYGKFASFPKIGSYRGGRWHEVLGEEFDGNNSREKLIPCLDALREHPAWGSRRTRADDQPSTPSAMSLTNKAVVSKGWPSLLQATPAYLALIEKACKVRYANYADVPDVVWEQFTANLDKAKSIPSALQEVLDKAKDEYDPFADE